MTPPGEAVHERCKTGECSATTATVCTTTVAAVVPPLLFRRTGCAHLGALLPCTERTRERVRDRVGVVNEGKEEGDIVKTQGEKRRSYIDIKDHAAEADRGI